MSQKSRIDKIGILDIRWVRNKRHYLFPTGVPPLIMLFSFKLFVSFVSVACLETSYLEAKCMVIKNITFTFFTIFFYIYAFSLPVCCQEQKKISSSFLQTISKVKSSCEVQNKAQNNNHCRQSPSHNAILDESLSDIRVLSSCVTHCKQKTNIIFQLASKVINNCFGIAFLYSMTGSKTRASFFSNPIRSKPKTNRDFTRVRFPALYSCYLF